MDEEARFHLEQQRQIHLERLRKREQQAAQLGISAPPEVLMEIETIRQQIARLDIQLGAVARTLRDPVPDFTGREREVEQLIQILRRAETEDTVAICGIHGMGGLGKTELAYMVAQKTIDLFPDGQVLVELSGKSADALSPIRVLQFVIRAFVDYDTHLPDQLTQLQDIYHTKLKGKRMLIVADDATNWAQAKSLVPPKGCGLLITSRHRFTIPGMIAFDLNILPSEQAEALLLTICPRIGSRAPHLAQLCAALPLALRVSASILASSHTRSVDRYVRQLEMARLTHLRDPDIPNEPEASVEASLQLSYDALDPIARKGLNQISIFPTHFDLDAAQAIIDDSNQTEAILDLLHRRSLVEWDETTERYRLHDLVRAFALARLENVDELQLRHAHYYAGIATRTRNLLEEAGDGVIEAFALFDRERTHIDAGWAWARQQAGVSATIDELVLTYAVKTGYIGSLRYDFRHERLPQFEAALTAARRLGHRREESSCLNELGTVHQALGETRQAIDYYEQALAIRRAIGARKSEGAALGNLGSAYYEQVCPGSHYH